MIRLTMTFMFFTNKQNIPKQCCNTHGTLTNMPQRMIDTLKKNQHLAVEIKMSINAMYNEAFNRLCEAMKVILEVMI